MNQEDIEQLYELRSLLQRGVNSCALMGRRMFERTRTWEASGKPPQALMEWSQWMTFCQANGWTLRGLYDQVEKAIRAYEEIKADPKTDGARNPTPDSGLEWWKQHFAADHQDAGDE